MSYAIIRIQKFHNQAVGGIQLHDLRSREVSRTNPDIDRSRTRENYALTVPPGSYRDAVRANIEALHLTRAIRKDAVVMCQALVTSDRAFFDGMPPEQERAFFQESLDFIKARYGAENIISAVIHKDEKTPHMHVNFTPIRDRKLSAKNIFTQQEFTALQTDFVRQVGGAYGLQRGVHREVKRQHLSTENYKRATSKQEKRDFVTARDVSPQTLKKGFLSSLVETPQDVANRINADILGPIVAELKEFRLERSAFKNTLNYYKKLEKRFKELTAGLSQEQLGKLKKIAQELCRENQSEAINKRRERQSGVVQR